MINSISIRNFQSHRLTDILFNDGVNVIIGVSDQGKSAIIRALLWAVQNRPLGVATLLSHWAQDEKNKMTDEMTVTVETDRGVCIRRRNVDDNEYILKIEGKEKVFKAINKDVPLDIFDFFRITDINLQMQHDSPFLLSQSPSDVAKFFNRIVKLDVIDKILTNAETSRRDLNKKIKNTEQEKINLEKEIASYNWIDTAQVLAEKLVNVDKRIDTHKIDLQDISDEIANYQEQKDFLKNYLDIKTANSLIERIEKIKIDYDTMNELEKSIEKYKEVNRDRKIFEMIKAGKDIITQIESVEAKIKEDLHEQNIVLKEVSDYEQDKELSELGFNKEQALKLIKEIDAIRPEYELLRLLGMQIHEYDEQQKIIMLSEIEIKNLKEQMPDTCPECGQPLKECRE